MAPCIAHFTIFLISLALLLNPVRSSIAAQNAQQQQHSLSATMPGTANTPNITDAHGKQPEAAELATSTQLTASNSTRYARLMKVLQDPKALISKRYHAAMQRVITRADHLPPAGNPQRHSTSAVYPPPVAYYKGRPPMMRRIQHGPPANAAVLTRYAYEAPKGSANYPHSKGPVPFNAGKLPSFHRSPFAHTQPHKLQLSHPKDLISHASPLGPEHLQQLQQYQPNYQHPQYQPSPQHQLQPQQPSQQQQYHDEHNFKASPPFNGKAIVRPLIEPHDPNYRQNMQQLQEYVGNNQPQLTIKQYPIPQQQQHKLYQNSHFSQLGQAPPLPTLSHNQGPNFHYETIRTREEPVLHPHVKHILPPPGGSGYAVYENNELDGQEEVAQPYAHPYSAYYPPTPRVEDSPQVYRESVLDAQPENAAAEQEAEQYIEFMNSNDYFLPKREPDYKQRDTQQDRQQNQQQREQQQQQLHRVQQSQIQQAYAQFSRAQPIRYSKPSSSDNNILESTTSNHLNAPIKISQLFYQEDPVPAVVRSSYHTSNNNHFVVKSDGNKVVKHIPQSQTTKAATSVPTTSAPAYSKVRLNTPRNRTPEPQRFEFTERDAMPSAYTHSPSALSGLSDQLRHKSAGVVGTLSTSNLPVLNSNNINTATLHGSDDPEDEEDVHSASSSFYGRMPVSQSTEADATTIPTPPAPVEQKDTEDYCERMCANVQDSDEEIICGSDGYMYTSEAQMECYASCLHIDVTVTSKGSCNAR